MEITQTPENQKIPVTVFLFQEQIDLLFPSIFLACQMLSWWSGPFDFFAVFFSPDTQGALLN